MAKFKLKKPSKRQPARLRYKIEKKVRDHNRKIKKEAKKNPKSKKPKAVQIPNVCPFKEDILKEVEAVKKHKEEEKLKRRELAKLEKQNRLEEKKKNPVGMDTLVANAEARGKVHDAFKSPETENVNEYGKDRQQENSLKTYYREFKKVISEAEVVLEVVDARDPLGTRCVQVEEAVRESGKKLVLVLNKADLIPRDNLTAWLKYLRRQSPAVPFKASTQQQQHNLGRRKMKHIVKEKEMKVLCLQITSTGPVKVVLDEMQVDEDESSLLPNTLNIRPKLDKTNKSSEKTKADPEMLIEGNTKLNKLRKMQFKRDKKKKARNEKQAVNLADVLENVTLSSANKSDVYDFKEDFK
ncbi:jg20760 [Pararge aegeria aegeria]|uniref:Jg20760 protein n=1 Tax=Pararge aegeria aegeria TaxID=348720 RepID=A0A8S4R0E3_9NEOP|nr:jg20760 [Pararge aegeria aegeria]